MTAPPRRAVDDGVGPYLGGRVATGCGIAIGMVLELFSGLGMTGLPSGRRESRQAHVDTLLGIHVPGVSATPAALLTGRIGIVLGLLCCVGFWYLMLPRPRHAR